MSAHLTTHAPHRVPGWRAPCRAAGPPRAARETPQRMGTRQPGRSQNWPPHCGVSRPTSSDVGSLGMARGAATATSPKP
eukprot:3904710-Prymnesium_polylepis.1